MRTLAIGDIHGCLTSLKALTAAAQLAPTDRLVLLGDYVDRGPDSRGVIDWILEQRQAMELVSLRGNHEVMMLEARTNLPVARSWASFGGFQALESYRTGFSQAWTKAIPEGHWTFLESTRRYFETEHHIFVHGGLDSARALPDQDEQTLYWSRCFEMTPHVSGKRVICGHTPQDRGEIGSYDWGVCLDTGCCRDGWLTCLDADTGEFWQSNEEGETRGGKLERV